MTTNQPDDQWAEGLDPLLRECHRRLAEGTTVMRVRTGATTPAEQHAIADLLGLARRPKAKDTVRWTDVETAVHDMTGHDLRHLLEDRYGPIGNRASERARAADARSALWSWLRSHDVVQQRGLHQWAHEVQTAGIRDTIDATRNALEQTLKVLQALPGSGEPLPVLAGRILNDTHALDGTTAIAGLVLSAIASEQGAERPARAADRRALWWSVGIADDALSSTVLVAGLDAIGDTHTDRLCQLGKPARRATSLTLADIRDAVPHLRSTETVWVVENPAVLAHALTDIPEHLPPMICTSGWPSSAATQLLAGLTAAGHTLRYHGDLDGEGIRIAAHVIDETGAQPWRMTTADYLTAVADHGANVGRVTPAPWDPDLAPAMREHAIAVFEETVWGTLREDLLPHAATEC